MTEPAKEPAIVNIDGKELRVPEEYAVLYDPPFDAYEVAKSRVYEMFTFWMLKAIAKAGSKYVAEDFTEYRWAMAWAHFGGLIGEGE